MPLAPRAERMRRLIALLLLALFLGAGTTLPGPDALLYHWSGAGVEQPRTHIEAAGGCASHLESCTLGRAATGADAVLAADPIVRLVLRGADAEPPKPAQFPRAVLRNALPQPRAPPAAVA